MGNVLDQSDYSEIPPLPSNDVSALIASWIRLVKDSEPPRVQQEATGDQLSVGLIPYADFAVWRRHGSRLFRQLNKFQAHYPTQGGGRRSREAGPETFEEWRGSWDVFAFAMELLQASPARLERFATHVRKLAVTFPDNWWKVAIADSHCRSEHLERVRRVAVGERSGGRLREFERTLPRDIVFREATNDHAFWSDNEDRSALEIGRRRVCPPGSHTRGRDGRPGREEEAEERSTPDQHLPALP